jgi:uncharacterized membrane protein YwzB
MRPRDVIRDIVLAILIGVALAYAVREFVFEGERDSQSIERTSP